MKVSNSKAQQTLPQCSWKEIDTPGAYVDTEFGQLYRIPADALLPGASPVIHSTTTSLFVRVSENPNVLISEARRICADNDIQPAF